MCKCTPIKTMYFPNDKERSHPYCYKRDCRPSDSFIKISKNCPWLKLVRLYDKKIDSKLCRATGTDSHMFTYGWSSGNFSKHFCCEENCAPAHFKKI